MARTAGTTAQPDGNRPVVQTRRDVPATRVRIVDAAYECFGRLGIAKTSVEDISNAAGVTRPTFYKYFTNKGELVEHIGVLETAKLNAEIRRRVIRHDDPVEMIVEAVVQAAHLAFDNVFVRRSLESISMPAVSSDPHNPVHHVTREGWGKLLERARARDLLAEDLDIDQLVSWLSLSQVLLMMKMAGSMESEADLRFFVRRFVVEPLLKGRGGSPDADGGARPERPVE